MSNSPPPRPIAAVSIACWRGDEVLLVQRGRPPLVGLWSLPGGRIEWGETAREAALRELTEETGVAAEIVGLVDVVDQIGRTADGEVARHFVLAAYVGRWIAGEPVPGDDAAATTWCRADDLTLYETTPRLAEVIAAGRAVLDGLKP